MQTALALTCKPLGRLRTTLSGHSSCPARSPFCTASHAPRQPASLPHTTPAHTPPHTTHAYRPAVTRLSAPGGAAGNRARQFLPRMPFAAATLSCTSTMDGGCWTRRLCIVCTGFHTITAAGIHFPTTCAVYPSAASHYAPATPVGGRRKRLLLGTTAFRTPSYTF